MFPALTAGSAIAALVLPTLASAAVFGLAVATVPTTSYLMGYNYLKGTSAGFAEFVPSYGGQRPSAAPMSFSSPRYRNWWY